MSEDRNPFADFSIRLLLIILGFGLASLATGFYVSGLLSFDPDDASRDASIAPDFISYSFFITMLVAFYAAPWAMLVTAWGEYRTWRMWWYYALAGALIGLFLGWFFLVKWWFPWAGLAFGPVAGLIFWSIAGRKAGAHSATGILTIFLTVLGFLLLVLFYLPALSGFRS